MEKESGKVYAAIVRVMDALSKEGISKDRTSGSEGGPRYAFRGIDDVYASLSRKLSESGLLMLPRVLERDLQERVTAKGGRMAYVTVKMEFDLVSAEDGSTHTISTFGEAMDSADKATNKAMSAAYKYAAFQAFCIPVEGETPDADASTPVVQSPIDASVLLAKANQWLTSIGCRPLSDPSLVNVAIKAKQAGVASEEDWLVFISKE